MPPSVSLIPALKKICDQCSFPWSTDRKISFAYPCWFWVGVVGIWLFALICRFWGLSRFNTLVFDEIYYARFGQNYLTQTPFFDAHPPLGKYLIALGIWLRGFSPFGYRWMNAWVGSLIPLLGVALAYQLTFRQRFALLTGLLLCFDGLLLVESRYALINIYLLFFGLAGQLCLILAAQSPKHKILWLVAASILFGATISIKWNGLGLLLGFYLFWAIAALIRQVRPQVFEHQSSRPLIFGHLQRLTGLDLFVGLPMIMAMVYGLLWMPHLQQNPQYSFWAVHREIFLFHSRVGGGAIHPYCSSWSSWPLMQRTISYFFDRALTLSERVPVNGPPLPNESTHYYYSVYAMGNPILWWGGTAALLGLMGLGVWLLIQGFTAVKSLQCWDAKQSVLGWIPLYLGVNYGANLLPWAKISRCAFIYHYLPASVFGTLALAWLIDQGLEARWRIFRVGSFLLVVGVALGFIYWAPFFWGLPLTPSEWQARIWLKGWI